MNRIFTFLISLFVLGCGTSCANDDVPVPVDESQESSYFDGRKALVAYFSDLYVPIIASLASFIL